MENKLTGVSHLKEGMEASKRFAGELVSQVAEAVSDAFEEMDEAKLDKDGLPFGKIPFSITWDGTPTGDSVMLDDFPWYKIADVTPDPDSVKEVYLTVSTTEAGDVRFAAKPNLVDGRLQLETNIPDLGNMYASFIAYEGNGEGLAPGLYCVDLSVASMILGATVTSVTAEWVEVKTIAQEYLPAALQFGKSDFSVSWDGSDTGESFVAGEGFTFYRVSDETPAADEIQNAVALLQTPVGGVSSPLTPVYAESNGLTAMYEYQYSSGEQPVLILYDGNEFGASPGIYIADLAAMTGALGAPISGVTLSWTVVKKIDPEYLPEGFGDSEDDGEEKYMAINDPVGYGSFSMGRKEGSEIGNRSHAEGWDTTASGNNSHAEGSFTEAIGGSSHAEGRDTTASNWYSHAEGEASAASGVSSHAEGYRTQAIGSHSHAEGWYSKAIGADSHAEGYSTISRGECQHVQGKYNEEDSEGKYAHIIGGGNRDTDRKNIHTVDWEGNAVYEGTVTAAEPTEDNHLATKAYVDKVLEGGGNVDIDNTVAANIADPSSATRTAIGSVIDAAIDAGSDDDVSHPLDRNVASNIDDTSTKTRQEIDNVIAGAVDSLETRVFGDNHDSLKSRVDATDANIDSLDNRKADKKERYVYIIYTAGWRDGSLLDDYPYCFDIPAGVTENDIATIIIAPESQSVASACGLCPTNETGDGYIRIWSKSIPQDDIIVEYTIDQGKEN